MAKRTEDIKALLEHILRYPDIEYPPQDDGTFFRVGNHIVKYTSTNRKIKEHKLITIDNKSTPRYFLFIQMINEKLKVTNVLYENQINTILRKNNLGDLTPDIPGGIDTECRASSQFKNSVQLEPDLEIVKKVIIDITDEAVSSELNLRGAP